MLTCFSVESPKLICVYNLWLPNKKYINWIEESQKLFKQIIVIFYLFRCKTEIAILLMDAAINSKCLQLLPGSFIVPTENLISPSYREVITAMLASLFGQSGETSLDETAFLNLIKKIIITYSCIMLVLVIEMRM